MKQELPPFPRLAPGCRLTLHEFGKNLSWVLENSHTGKFFRMGLREERLARKLDGSQPLKSLLVDDPEDPSAERSLSAQEAYMFLQTLQRAGLLHSTDTAPPPKKPITAWNPLFVRLPFGSPDRILDPITAFCRKLANWPVFAVLVLLLISGGYAVLSNLDRFIATMGSVFSASNITAFMLCFLALKLIHETAHGVVCKYFGGRVPDAGLYFVFFMPLTYIDATSSWRFPSKWVRIFVSSAGMMAELVVAAAAGLVWAATPLGAVNTLASNVVLSASVTTLLFNANPLMRFDGYFILADLTGSPNLYTLASRAASSWLGKIFLGIPPERQFPRWIVLYGLGCIMWRTALTLGICIGAIALLHGIGMVLAALTLVGTYYPIIRRIPQNLSNLRDRGVKVSRLRIAILTAAGLIILLAPIDPPPAAPVVVEPANMTTIRIQCPGFVKEIDAVSGQRVEAGQVLMKLENPEEQSRLQKLDAESRRAEAEAIVAREASEAKQMSQMLEKAVALRKQAQETKAYLQTLSITAPSAGIIYARKLDELSGAYLREGREVLLIGAAESREARIAISQETFDRLQPKVGEKVEILVPGIFKIFDAEIVSVESAATRDIRHESLTALAGGPLDVISKQKEKGGNESGMELVDPHFYVKARFLDENYEGLWPGKSGIVRFPSAPRRPLITTAIEEFRNFIHRTAEKRAGHS